MILDEQAMRETDKFKIHLKKLDISGESILGDKILIDYLLSLLGGKISEHYADGNYVILKFKHTISNIDYLIVRQILRDHADATSLRACGIETTDNEITIKLPQYGKI